MELLHFADNAAIWNGYEYYRDNAVATKQKKTETEIFGYVRGNSSAYYDVLIDIAHPERSRCNCPDAKGKKVVCAHQAALYFSVFPDAADELYYEIYGTCKPSEISKEKLYRKVAKCVNSMKDPKKEEEEKS